ncbi:MAG: SDR family oxidoreductase [Rhodobacteraceae bacterium]|nr:SDR family oxidoreductase [Paracoccaceae bacterium]
MTDLTGKSVLITGASRGIGAATARKFAARGARVMLCARSEAAISQVAKSIWASGGTALHQVADVTDFRQVQAAVHQTVQEFGGLDILINNAGVIDPVERLEEAHVSAWNTVIDINVKGVFHGIRAALPVMKAAGGGTILTIGSGAATSALEGWSHYCTSKAAVHHLNRVLHLEESKNNIRALVLSPGTVATDMQHVIRDSGVNPVSQINWQDHVPPEWVAKTLVWMSTHDADDWCGGVVSLREPDIRQKVGLI